jgi:hypothetical protein
VSYQRSQKCSPGPVGWVVEQLLREHLQQQTKEQRGGVKTMNASSSCREKNSLLDEDYLGREEGGRKMEWVQSAPIYVVEKSRDS